MNISVHHVLTCIRRNGVDGSSISIYRRCDSFVNSTPAVTRRPATPDHFIQAAHDIHQSRFFFFFCAQNKYKDPSLLFIPSRMISLARHSPSCSAWFLKRCNKSFCLEQTRAWLLNNEISSPNATFSPNMLPHADTDLARGEHATYAGRMFVPEDVEGDAD